MRGQISKELGGKCSLLLEAFLPHCFANFCPFRVYNKFSASFFQLYHLVQIRNSLQVDFGTYYLIRKYLQIQEITESIAPILFLFLFAFQCFAMKLRFFNSAPFGHASV